MVYAQSILFNLNVMLYLTGHVQVVGVLSFNLVGVLAKLTQILAEVGVSVFTIRSLLSILCLPASSR